MKSYVPCAVNTIHWMKISFIKMALNVAFNSGLAVVRLVTSKLTEGIDNEKYPPPTPRISPHCITSAR